MHSKRVAAGWLALGLVAVYACSDDLRSPDASDIVRAVDRSLGAFESSSETRALLDRASEAAWHLDAASLHDAIPDMGSRGDARAMAFEIHGVDARRVIEHRGFAAPPTGDLLELRAKAPAGGAAGLGDYTLFLASMPLASGDYRLRVTSTLDSGRGDLATFWRLLPDLLCYFERGASADEAAQALPRSFAFLRRYVAADVVARAQEPAGREIAVSMRSRREALGADYPHLVHYVTRLTSRLRTHGSLQTESGDELATWQFRGQDEGATVSFVTRDGRLIAKNAAGEPIELFAARHFVIVQGSSAEIFGVRTTIDGLRSDLRTDPRGVAPEIALQARTEPERVVVAGALFGVLPVAAVDAILPGTLDGSVRRILATLLRGRDGRGVEILTRSEAISPGEDAISSTLVSDVPAGSFSSRALRLATALIQADASERADVMRFTRDLADALVTDLGDSK